MSGAMENFCTWHVMWLQPPFFSMCALHLGHALVLAWTKKSNEMKNGLFFSSQTLKCKAIAIIVTIIITIVINKQTNQPCNNISNKGFLANIVSDVGPRKCDEQKQRQSTKIYVSPVLAMMCAEPLI
jgi:hypothetical protein